jgi:hypothetical protein
MTLSRLRRTPMPRFRKLRYAAIVLVVVALAAGSAYALAGTDGQGAEGTTARAEPPRAQQLSRPVGGQRAWQEQPGEQRASEDPPQEGKPAKHQPADDRPVEDQPVEQQPAERQPVDDGENGDDGTSQGSDDDRSYLQEERCQPMDDMNDPEDGSVPSPEELLPDPSECPEFYEGHGGGSTAPPVSGVPPVSDYPPASEPTAPSYNPCAETASLNGFPCTPTPYGPVYITPDPSYPD